MSDLLRFCPTLVTASFFHISVVFGRRASQDPNSENIIYAIATTVLSGVSLCALYRYLNKESREQSQERKMLSIASSGRYGA